MMVRAPHSFSTPIDGQYVRRLVLVYARVVLELTDATALADEFRRVTLISYESDLQAMLLNDATGAAADEINGWLREMTLPHTEVFVASLQQLIARQSALRNTPAAMPSFGECVCTRRH